MQTITNISIPQPCHQNWNNMTPADKGRHCQLCGKDIVDFTGFTDQQLITYLSMGTKTCGRLLPQQINNINRQLKPGSGRRVMWKELTLVAALTAIFTTVNSAVKAQHPIEQGAVDTNKKNSTAVSDTTTYITVKGKVISSEDNLALPGAVVLCKHTMVKVSADASGFFKMSIPAYADSVMVRFIGFKGMNVPVSMFNNGSDVVISLTPTPLLMGEVVVVKPPFHKRLWYKVKHLF
ncbi:hypothetical protein CKK33_09820 [Mucilaginibacter sp. MD40]|uniref:carboxypeptidase-like regulatory domain-containing protein n=1 Tax=Mucilaginibacter sp. MD40 TaxID=2029590 RepID=UPI000BACEA07|nr:carboxypeptidase-like regulatory domain-containing protein [Mucilaginibacter sp. MD40]PAW93775.1 hypothetical protein CKK33_09820 [Mucilaginibacter sp. MD40]